MSNIAEGFDSEDNKQYAAGKYGLSGVTTARISSYISKFVDTDPIKGWAFGADTDFEIPGIDNTLQPDAAFVSMERLPFPDRDTVKVVPDLIVEVNSKSDSNYSIEDKVKDYLAGGVKLIWVVRPINQLVEIYRPDEKKPTILGIREELDGGNVLPGFKLKIADIFRGIPSEALAPSPKKRRNKTVIDDE